MYWGVQGSPIQGVGTVRQNIRGERGGDNNNRERQVFQNTILFLSIATFTSSDLFISNFSFTKN